MTHPPIEPGQRHGNWTVIERATDLPSCWWCRCDCGSEAKVYNSVLRRNARLEDPRCSRCRADRRADIPTDFDVALYCRLNGMHRTSFYHRVTRMGFEAAVAMGPNRRQAGGRGRA